MWLDNQAVPSRGLDFQEQLRHHDRAAIPPGVSCISAYMYHGQHCPTVSLGVLANGAVSQAEPTDGVMRWSKNGNSKE